MVIGIGVLLLIATIVLGVPVGFALGIAGTLSMMMLVDLSVIMGLMHQVVHHTASNYVLLTIPMFVLMAEFLGTGGISRDLMVSCDNLLRRVRGGLAMACVLAGAVLAAASGSSTASVASISSAAYPTMSRLNYDRGFAVGAISIAGTLAIMIPPSIAFIVYGIITEESIGKLFMAGLIPGIITTLGYIVTIALMVRLRPHLAPPPAAWRKREESLASAEGLPENGSQSGRVWPVVLLISLVLGCLYMGIATPSEVGALGATGAFLIALLLGRLTWGGFIGAIGATLRASTLIVTIIFGALLFGYFMSFTNVTSSLLSAIRASGLPPYAVLVLIVVIYLLLGMIMDQFAIIVLTVPITYSIMTGLGFDGIWLGVIIVKTAEIGLVTPPLGLNIFVASAATGVKTNEIFRGVMPFVIVELVILVLLIVFPGLVMFLPDIM